MRPSPNLLIPTSIALMYLWVAFESSLRPQASEASRTRPSTDSPEAAVSVGGDSIRNGLSAGDFRYHEKAARTIEAPHPSTLYYSGRGKDGYSVTIPIEVASATLERGREAYERNCRICHGGSGSIATGEGRSIVPLATIATLSPGQIFDRTITEKNTLASYGPQITVPDRWAIVAFLKSQHSQQSAQLPR